jgi:glycosyltransferase involved in cell wall biosynthesis
MQKHLQPNHKLLVVSDTGMMFSNNSAYAFGPVVREFEYLIETFDEIIWIGYLYENKEVLRSFDKIKSDKIKIVPLKRLGGKSFFQKLKIILQYPIMMLVIWKHIRKHQYIHTRAPSHPAFIAILFSFFFKSKKFWHKYAGTWIDKAPAFYSLQRWFLKKLPKNSKVTINGDWETKETILSFENPCLTEEDRVIGRENIHEKKIDGTINFCFVGALNEDKGVGRIIEAFSLINENLIGEVSMIGSGNNIEAYTEKGARATKKIKFYGFLNKKEIIDIYTKSDFLILPSKSEGFPKVVGEAMNFGCIPIVSDVSCIGQYIKHQENGFLLKPITVPFLKLMIEESLSLANNVFLKMLETNYTLSNKFTYQYYRTRIETEIFNLDKVND